MKTHATFIILIITLALPTLTPTIPIVTATPHSYPYTPDDPVISRALHYLASQQAPDGSIAGLTTSAWTAMAYAAANHTDTRLTTYLTNSISLLNPHTATDWERHTLALIACGQDPTAINGINLKAKIEGFFDGTQMGNPTLIYDDLFGILALTACGATPQTPIIRQETTYILSLQHDDGGWGDADTTAAAIMALIAAGENPQNESIVSALAFLKTTQTDTGGFQSWGTTNVASTAWATGALVAAGQDPTSPAWQDHEHSPIDYLISLQRPDGGFNWSLHQNMNSEWMTSYVLCALLGRPYPVVVWHESEDPGTEPGMEWTGAVRVEGKTATLFNGTIQCSNATVLAYNQSSGTYQYYAFAEPTVLTALVTALDSADITYTVIFYPDWNAFYVKTIDGQSDWWQYWVDYQLPMVDAGHYLLTLNDSQVLFGYLESWDAHALRVTLLKHTINISEDLEVHTFNESMAPAGNVTVCVGALTWTTDGSGVVIIQCEKAGDYLVYAEGAGYVRSEKTMLTVDKSLRITRPQVNTTYLWNHALQRHREGIFILGSLDVEVSAVAAISKVEFYVDGILCHTDSDRPFIWRMNLRAVLKDETLRAVGYSVESGRLLKLYDSDEVRVLVLNCCPHVHGVVLG